MFTPSLVLAYWMRGCIRPPRFFASRSSTPKPELAPRGGELALLLGSPKGGFGKRGGYRRPAQEINVDTSDLVISKLDEARPRPVVRLSRTRVPQLHDEMLGHRASSAFGEDARLGHGRACDIADRVDVGKLRREVCLVHRDPTIDGQAGSLDHGGYPMHRDAQEEVVRERAAVAQMHSLRFGVNRLYPLVRDPV